MEGGQKQRFFLYMYYMQDESSVGAELGVIVETQDALRRHTTQYDVEQEINPSASLPYKNM